MHWLRSYERSGVWDKHFGEMPAQGGVTEGTAEPGPPIPRARRTHRKIHPGPDVAPVTPPGR
ncbi:hypothetical protein GCM10020229_16870 [Kitasatospora albolonga]